MQVRAYVVQVEAAIAGTNNRSWYQLVLTYVHVAFRGQEETRTALGQMKFGVPPGIAYQVKTLGLGQPVSQALTEQLNTVLAAAEAVFDGNEPLARAALEYLVFGESRIPRQLTGIRSWDPEGFALQTAKLYEEHAELLKAIWEEIDWVIAPPEDQVVA